MRDLVAAIIILSGIFSYCRIDSADAFYPSQYAFFVFSAGCLLSYLIFKKNRWIGFLCALVSLGFLKTYLFQSAPLMYLFKTTLFAYSVFGMYYFVRKMELKEDLLKFALIPAFLNIALIFIQKFDNSKMPIMQIMGSEVTGFLGNRGIAACYLTMLLPVFAKYCRWGIPLALGAIACSSIFAFIVSVFILIFYYSSSNYAFKRRYSRISYGLLIVLVLWSGLFFKDKVKHSLHIRASTIVGTLDGIMHNPVLGWGAGSYEPIMTRLAKKPDAGVYLGIKFSTPGEIMGHPHNEMLQGWWNYGVVFPFLLVIYAIYLCKRYTVDKLMSFCILLSGALCSMGYFLSAPAWILFMFALGIYENKKEGKDAGI